jgi:hypothetical protein
MLSQIHRLQVFPSRSIHISFNIILLSNPVFESGPFLTGFMTEDLILSSSFPRVLIPNVMFYLEKIEPCEGFFSGSMSSSPSDTQTVLSCLYLGTSNLYSFLNIRDLPYNNKFVRLERYILK